MISGQDKVQRITLRPLPFRVGRHADSDLLLDSSHGSQRHAELFEEQNHLWLRDLGSTNGTSVNGERLQSARRLEPGDTVHFADVAYRVEAGGSSATAQATQVFSNTERLQLFALLREPKAFEEMLLGRHLWTHYQPLVDLRQDRVCGYEVLGRGQMDGRQSPPNQLFYIAEKQQRETELSAMFRRLGLELSQGLDSSLPLFVNTHPTELRDCGALLASIAELRRDFPLSRVVLEIHESAVADVGELKSLRAGLDQIDVDLAFDDFGTGQARLLELVEVEPRYLKFDAVLVSRLHLASKKRRDMLASLLKVVLDLGISPIAECIESREEAQACLDLGFEIGQGFYFGRPAPAADHQDPVPRV